MRAKKSPLDVGRRERQIMEAVYRLGRATVGEVLAELPDSPSYSAVRTMLGKLEAKGLLRHVQEGPRYLYLPVVPLHQVRESALRRLVSSLFAGSSARAVSTLLDMGREELTADDLEGLSRLIEQMRAEGR